MKKIKCCIPNIITFTNLSLGVTAILMVVNNDSPSSFIYSCLLIMIAAVTDRLDGKVARFFKVTSDFGKELDSLSDLISFGVAPVVIAWKISFMPFGALGYFLSLIFVLCGAYRLARFNISNLDNVFMGLPITVAGTLLTIANLYNSFAQINNRYTTTNTALAVIVLIFLSFLMISKFSIKKR
ncbi:CDP-diacylglycerol--serine O-phosphatidyltransferase [Herbivorax sp. ANBcel31]|uniref:CDP-diacylglycerol--serine O-phosphatidyltransferase n=1 Tax=Herbivorax sp. ANBcel31 TaxID=3069754 RepID=UPI0027B6CE04|nr:CDP-diacylglycerol--serine O-phosphatidyltransferase [Herbivorax sp. ANBcel31]MDQ2086026.1 CDP-diacylglycerol--serine O-phosphatidyltransferase [Herbivorax sp. ANBcel31]